MDEFLAFVAQIMGVSAEVLSADTSYQSISQWDSLMHIRLVAEIEERYEVEIPIDEVASIRTLGDFYGYVSGATKH